MDLDPRGLDRIGRFAVRRLLGEGQLGWAFEVEDPQLFGARLALVLSRDRRSGESVVIDLHEHMVVAFRAKSV